MINSKTTKRKKIGGSTLETRFPGRLHALMDYVELHGMDSTISWVLNGRGFMIHDPEKLVDILPLFFEQTKYESLLRQLNNWHFERLARGPNRGAFVHPYFVRGDKGLSDCMSRHVSLKPRRKDSSRISQEKETTFHKNENDFPLKKETSVKQPIDPTPGELVVTRDPELYLYLGVLADLEPRPLGCASLPIYSPPKSEAEMYPFQSMCQQSNLASTISSVGVSNSSCQTPQSMSQANPVTIPENIYSTLELMDSLFDLNDKAVPDLTQIDADVLLGLLSE